MTVPRLIYICLPLFWLSGCGPAQQSKLGEWFKASTGLSLPASASEIHSRCITVLPAGDTYYIEIRISPEFEALLKKHFDALDDETALKNLTPPPDWKAEIPFWNPDRLKHSTYYERNYKEKNGDAWVSYAACDPQQGVCYFVGMQAGN